MTIKKLTIAAAITFGVVSVTSASFAAETPVNLDENSVNSTVEQVAAQSDDTNIKEVADQSVVEVPSNPLPVVTGAACPIEKCPAPLPKYTLKQVPVTGAACPIQCDPCAKPCDPCARPCDPCATGPACPITEKCPPCPEPACAVCPGVPMKKDFAYRQQYAYPANVFGEDSVVGSSCKDNLGLGLDKCATGCTCGANAITGAAANIPCPSAFGAPQCGINVDRSSVTGAAANMPCPTAFGAPQCGINVDRNPHNYQGANCPITIQSQDSLKAIKKSYMPIEVQTTGAATPLTSSMFPDVPNDFWAASDIGRLTSNNVIAGYPDRTFRPNLPVSRAEFASLIVNGLNLRGQSSNACPIFKDVPESHWANEAIDIGVGTGYIAGYPNGMFKPGEPVSRAEAMTMLSKALKCEISDVQADEILSKYIDACNVPGWAKQSVAKALQQDLIKGTPAPNQIMPNKDASRADIATMLQSVRIAVGIDSLPVACAPTGAAAVIEQDKEIAIPTLSVKFEDNLTSNSAHIGDKFIAKTTENVTINGVTYPVGSKVAGQVVEVIRPSTTQEGGLKLAFTDIKNGTNNAKLPRQILTAQVIKENTQNPVSRAVQMPFVWTGGILGNVGRTVGSTVVYTGNAVEHVTNGVGVATGEIFSGQFAAAGRSLGSSVVALVKAPVDVTMTALSGTAGLFQSTYDEVAYVINPDGTKVTRIHPREQVKVAFGCQ